MAHFSLVTAIIQVLFILVIMFVLFLIGKKHQKERLLNRRLDAVSNVYIAMYEIDLPHDSFSAIRSTSYVSELINPAEKSGQKILKNVMEKLANEKSQSLIQEFIDYSTLNERLKDKSVITQEFQGSVNNQIWCRARFIVIDRLDDGSLNHLLWVVESIDEEKRERERLEQDAAKSKAADEAKSNFLANMSHEIRTPINAMLGMDEMILREAESNDLRQYALNIKRAGNNLLAIINDILDFSKIESGKMELVSEQYELSAVLVDLMNMIMERVKSKKLNFTLCADPNIPRVLIGDSMRLRQCILNLLANAVKYTAYGGITFTVSYTKADDNAILLHIDVKDTGMGIKEEDMDKLFSPFDRIDEIKNRTIEGTGLGMSIVQRILAMMNSHLEVHSEYTKGSDFSFTVWQEIASSEPMGDIVHAYSQDAETFIPYKEKLYAPTATILVVDDTEMNLSVVKGLLKYTGIIIDTALSGFAALDKIVVKKYDIIFLDHRMPGMDGIETLQAMRAMPDSLNANTPAVVLTANVVSGARELYLSAGFADYLAKPVNPDKLESVILKYLPPERLEELSDSNIIEELTEEVIDLPEVDGIDMSIGLANCAGESLLYDMLTQFYVAIPENVSVIETLLRQKDFVNYRIKVHALKSTARLIGAMELSEKAAYLEYCAAEQSYDEVEEKTPDLLSFYSSYIQKLHDFAPKDAEENRPLISSQLLLEQEEELCKLIDDFNIGGIESVVDELKEYTLPQNFIEIFKNLCKYTTNIDFQGLSNLKLELESVLAESKEQNV